MIAPVFTCHRKPKDVPLKLSNNDCTLPCENRSEIDLDQTKRTKRRYSSQEAM
jgi:hypothetical protein